MAFKLTVLGKYSPFPPQGGACSGYLLSAGKENILIDLGGGILSRLQGFINIKELCCVLLSHHHPDHKADIHSLRHAWRALMQRGEVNSPLRIFTPDEPRGEVGRLKSYRDILDVVKLQPGLDYPFRPFLIEWIQTSHPLKCAAYSVKYAGQKFVYTGDTELVKDSFLYDFCKRADLLLAETSLMEEDKGEVPGHMTAAEAAYLAKEAGVKKLILTHFWPFYEETDLLNEAKKVFDNSHLAGEGQTYFIP